VGPGLTAGRARLACIVPVLDEAAQLPDLIDHLARQPVDEIIVADGGSSDGGPAWLARRRAQEPRLRVLSSAPGRAVQMNAGARAARSDWLWFLHADCRPPAGAAAAIRGALAGGARWGRFDVHLAGRRPAYRVIEAAMNLRSRLTGIATGDQGLFVRGEAFRAVGGYPPQPLMEDIELSRRLKGLGPPACLRERLACDPRRWEAGGVAATVLLMWWLRARYWAGADPAVLARRYRRVR